MESQSAETADNTQNAEIGQNTICLRNVKKTFNGGEVVACKEIDLDIQPEEFVVFLGPSGCGKTTTLRCIAGLEIPDGGTITVGEEDITHKKPKDRNLAFVFQNITLFPHMSVRRNIRFGLDMATDLDKATKNKRVEEAAEMLGIEDYLDRKPAALSGGQQQRVSIGRSMVMEPVAFLLDEPFSALDANLRDQMHTEIKRLHRELNRAMILVTHDQEEAMTVGDKIVVMNNAEIQQIGTPHEIYNEPVNLFVAQFIGSPSTNIIESSIEMRENEIAIVNDLFTLPMRTERAERLKEYLGENITVGVRPENLALDATSSLFECDIDLVEPKGARDTVLLRSGDIEIRASTEQGKIDEEKRRVSVNIDEENVWVFDQDGYRVI
ncbi:ABC transporter ATP-binding protein [Haloarcula marina]|uniref:ABC transporter ATP-binding protein n=1 Tax=Haloarcula marina TaxID=2961574 RepID=UPI0020B73AF1|nr:ABC transporter ATP-binding protein [Halomicroarcula marina]